MNLYHIDYIINSQWSVYLLILCKRISSIDIKHKYEYLRNFYIYLFTY